MRGSLRAPGRSRTSCSEGWEALGGRRPRSGQRRQGQDRLPLGPGDEQSHHQGPTARSWELRQAALTGVAEQSHAEHQEGSGELHGWSWEQRQALLWASYTLSSPLSTPGPHPPHPPEQCAVCSANRALANFLLALVGPGKPVPPTPPGSQGLPVGRDPGPKGWALQREQECRLRSVGTRLTQAFAFAESSPAGPPAVLCPLGEEGADGCPSPSPRCQSIEMSCSGGPPGSSGPGEAGRNSRWQTGPLPPGEALLLVTSLVGPQAATSENRRTQDIFPSLRSVSMPEVSLEVLTHLSLRSMTLENKKTYLAP